MKLNPFSKASSGYCDKAREDHNKLNHELAGLQKQLAVAKAEEDREKSAMDKVDASAHNMTDAKKQQHRVLSEASSRVSDIESQIVQVDYHLSPLRRIVEAPELYATTKKALKDLLAQKTSLNGDLEKTDALLAKLGQRIADLETRIDTETKASAQSLLSNESAFVVPESLIQLDVELRINKASQAEQQSKREALVVELRELPNAISDAKYTYIANRAVIAEIELKDQLIPIMDVIARAVVARHRWSHSYSARQYEIEIPPELIESAAAALAADMPTA